MKTVQLIHNPTAGDGKHSRDKLESLVEAEGYACRYAATTEGEWKKFDRAVDILAVAGGDGTLRKVALALLRGELSDHANSPIAFIPSGTANNLGRSLGLMQAPHELIASWKTGKLTGLDVGRIEGCGEKVYFLEGFGFGLFPEMMASMDASGTAEEIAAEERLQLALQRLLKMTREYSARECKLVVDGIDHSGRFLLVEVMNINSIGPNLKLNPLGDAGDGEFEIIIIPESQRDRLETFIRNKILGLEERVTFTSLKGKVINISWDGRHAHADDETVSVEKAFDISVHTLPSALSLLVPDKTPL